MYFLPLAQVANPRQSVIRHTLVQCKIRNFKYKSHHLKTTFIIFNGIFITCCCRCSGRVARLGNAPAPGTIGSFQHKTIVYQGQSTHYVHNSIDESYKNVAPWRASARHSSSASATVKNPSLFSLQSIIG